MPSPQRPIDALGGLAALRPIVADFVARICTDTMIGFHFRAVDQAKLVELELQFAARMLGADEVVYEGRSVGQAHARHPISDGQFARRSLLLRQTLRDHHVAAELATLWLEHTERLRPAILGAQVVNHAGGPCDHPGYGPLVTDVDAEGHVVGERHP